MLPDVPSQTSPPVEFDEVLVLNKLVTMSRCSWATDKEPRAQHTALVSVHLTRGVHPKGRAVPVNALDLARTHCDLPMGGPEVHRTLPQNRFLAESFAQRKHMDKFLSTDATSHTHTDVQHRDKGPLNDT